MLRGSLLWLPLLFLAAQCRNMPSIYPTMEERLSRHVNYLADDRLEGRETGTEGEREALRYIEEQYWEIGLQPFYGDGGFQQPFEFSAGKESSAGSYLRINGLSLQRDLDYFALAESGEGSDSLAWWFGGTGIERDADRVLVSPHQAGGKVLLLDLGIPGVYHPHAAQAELADVRTKIEGAERAGAAALILFTRDPNIPVPPRYRGRRITESTIPVFWLTDTGYVKVFSSGSRPASNGTMMGEGRCSFAQHWDRDVRTGYNALGFIDNPGTDRVVVIGAHYDHLGHGISGSLHSGEPAIHNGADDNASGVAAMIELARLLSKDGPRGSDYLFIAFSGEELGLYGSKHFVKSSLFDTALVRYMINFDMVGRLDSIERKLIVDGANTSPDFAGLSGILRDSIRIQAGGSGIGSSDHMSFYLEGIPSLHFFTGTHSDYHKPTDDVEKLNISGIASIVHVAHEFIGQLDTVAKPRYVPSEQSSEAVPDFKVTLGVIPDYIFEGRGMRIESVREGRPAHVAGLMAGDVVVRIGQHEVYDMMAYMKALSRFNKGEESTVFFMREGAELSAPITF